MLTLPIDDDDDGDEDQHIATQVQTRRIAMEEARGQRRGPLATSSVPGGFHPDRFAPAQGEDCYPGRSGPSAV
jgi:hypothetical protein